MNKVVFFLLLLCLNIFGLEIAGKNIQIGDYLFDFFNDSTTYNIFNFELDSLGNKYTPNGYIFSRNQKRFVLKNKKPLNINGFNFIELSFTPISKILYSIELKTISLYEFDMSLSYGDTYRKKYNDLYKHLSKYYGDFQYVSEALPANDYTTLWHNVNAYTYINDIEVGLFMYTEGSHIVLKNTYIDLDFLIKKEIESDLIYQYNTRKFLVKKNTIDFLNKK